MKPNKKLIAIILALLVAFSSVACAKASEQEVAPTVSQIETPKEETVLKQEEPKEEKTAAAEKAAAEKAAAEKAAAEKAAAEKAAAEKAAAEKAAAEKAAAEKAAAEKAAAEKAAAEKAAAEKAAAEKAAAEKAAAEKAQQETQQQTDDMPVTADGSGNLTAGSVPQTNNQYQAPAGGYPEGVGPTGKGKFSTREAVESLASVDKVIGWNEEFGGWEVITDTGKHEIQFPNGTAMGIEFLEIFFPNGK